MSHELFWLVMTTAMTGLMWIPHVLDRIISDHGEPEPPWSMPPASRYCARWHSPADLLRR
jgi:hypothetical protein